MDKSSRQKINSETLDLDYTLGQMSQTDINIEHITNRTYILFKVMQNIHQERSYW